MLDALSVISGHMTELGLNYEYGEMTQSPPLYPYWVGEYNEPESQSEDGREVATFLLTGFSRGSFLELEAQKAAIREKFKHGAMSLTNSKVAVAVYYAGSIQIPVDSMDLKRIQINLTIKSWKGT